MPRDTIALLSAALKRMEVDLFLRRVIEVISLLLVHEEERKHRKQFTAILIPLVNLSNLQGDTWKVTIVRKGFNSAY